MKKNDSFKDPLKVLGMIVMIVGFFVILTALPGGGLSQASIAAGPITATKVSEANETRIIVGTTLFLLGLGAYFGKEGLKLITRK